jgi:FAD/FMN-containing dehydrogenase
MTRTASGAALRATLRGTLIEPTDPSYDDARSLWNGAIDRRPAYIARCVCADDVVAALGFARASGLEIAVRGGGHSSSGASSIDDGLVIDLSPMRTVRVDPNTQRAWCAGGATMADLDAATQQHGLAVTGGTISHTGVGGLALGGGYGWLTHAAGLLIDNIVSAQVVLADGAVVRADSDEHPDLWWALRGGGGNFGVVTEFEFALHQVGPQVQVAQLFWGLDDAASAMRHARDLCDGLPRDAGALIAASTAPPAPFVPAEHHLASGVTLLLAGFGSDEEHRARVAGLAERQPPLFQWARPMPYTELQQTIDDAGPWGMQAYSKGLYLDELSDAAIEVIVAHLPAKQSPMSVIPIFPLGGAYADVADDSTALAGSRSARYNVSIDAIAPDADQMDADRAWARALWTALQPHASRTGSYINFMAEYDEARTRSAYGPKYARLARIKAAYDPENVFHNNANITPHRH